MTAAQLDAILDEAFTKVFGDRFMLKSDAPQDKEPTLTAAIIVDQVAQKHGIQKQHIMSKNRSAIIVAARNEAFCEMRDCLNWSYPRIAHYFNMHHTTVQHGVRSHMPA